MAVTGEDWLQAQCSVLGSVLLEPTLAAKVVSETTERDYTGTCKTVYNAIRELFMTGGAVDVVALAAKLGRESRAYLAQLMEITPTAVNIDHYIRLCRDQARVMRIRDLARQMEAAESVDQMQKLVGDASGELVDRPGVQVTTMADALRNFMERHSKPTEYLKWPIKDLNERIYSESGDFIVLGGYPSAGKSAFALQCAWHWARRYKVGFFSLETSAQKLFDRQMAAAAKLRMDDIKRSRIDQAGWDKVCGMTGDIISRKLELVPAAGMSPADIRAVTMQRGYQIILIDYLQLLQGSGENRTAQVTSISIALHTLAQSMGVTVVALSQLARQDKQGGKPDMSALRESGQIEQDADVVMILSLKDKNDRSGCRVLDIVKNKEGTCPSILLDFDGAHQIFSKAPDAAYKKKPPKPTPVVAPREEQMTILPDDTPVPF